MLLAERQSMMNPAELGSLPELDKVSAHAGAGLNATEWVVENTTVVTRKSLSFIIKIAICLLCLIVANLVIQSLVVQRISQIKQLQNKIAVMERRAGELRVEIADLESFDRIQSLAEKELGMRVAGPNDFHCIAAVSDSQPIQTQNPTRSNRIPSKPVAHGNLWARVSSWLGEFGEAMAQTP